MHSPNKNPWAYIPGRGGLHGLTFRVFAWNVNTYEVVNTYEILHVKLRQELCRKALIWVLQNNKRNAKRRYMTIETFRASIQTTALLINFPKNSNQTLLFQSNERERTTVIWIHIKI